MGVKDALSKFAGNVLNKSVKNNGMFLFVTTAAAYVLAATAQTVGLIVNKKLTPKEKKFLVPQEVFEGLSNIATYGAITFPLMAAAKGLAAKKFPGNLKAIDGANTIAAIAGSIIAGNIVTPIIRNKTGAKVKKMIEQRVEAQSNPLGRKLDTMVGFENTKRITMDNYINMTRNLPMKGSLKI